MKLDKKTISVGKDGIIEQKLSHFHNYDDLVSKEMSLKHEIEHLTKTREIINQMLNIKEVKDWAKKREADDKNLKSNHSSNTKSKK